MDTILTASASKYIPVDGRILYPGDLGNNEAIYSPRPDYNDDYWKAQALNAEGFTVDSSRARWGYDHKEMLYCAASNGWLAYAAAERFPEKILEHSQNLNDGEDAPFMTTQMLSTVLDPRYMRENVFAPNYRNNQIAIEIAACNRPAGTRIIGPADREGFLRALHNIHSLLRDSHYEDATFEKHLWVPFCLMEATRGIYHGDHAWSRNAAPEKVTGLAIQYGMQLPLLIRHGQSFDVVDIYNRPVSVVDQAWEEARHILDVVSREVEHKGESHNFRTETGVALLLVRFMYDEMWQSGSPHLDQDGAHLAVKGHYQDEQEMRRIVELRDVMLPYIAKHCDWPSLHAILDNDADLRAFWDQNVAGSEAECKPAEEVAAFVFSHLPRGGFEIPGLEYPVLTRTDEPQLTQQYSLKARNRPRGIHTTHPFSKDNDPRLFNDRWFARLGSTSDLWQDPDTDHQNFDQNAAVMVLAAYMDGRTSSQGGAGTFLYLDDPAGGFRASQFMFDHGKSDARTLAGTFDPLSKGGLTLDEAVKAEAQDEYHDRVRELMHHGKHEAWRRDHGLVNIVPLSDIKRSFAKYEDRRESMNAEMHEGIAAHGSMRVSGTAIRATVSRFIDLEADGIVIPAGHMSDDQFRFAVEAVVAATGQCQRYEGGNFKFGIFMDHDYWKPPEMRAAPQPLDLADLVIHMGLMVKADLEQKNVPANPNRLVSMARLLQVYEMIDDPARCNIRMRRDPASGEDYEEPVLDLNQIDPAFIAYSQHQAGLPSAMDLEADDRTLHADLQAFTGAPEYQAFAGNADGFDPTSYLANPADKARLAKMIWAWMRAEVVSEHAPVNGNLLVRGIQAFDETDLIDLPEDYKRAHDWWSAMTMRERTQILKQGTLHVHPAGPTMR